LKWEATDDYYARQPPPTKSLKAVLTPMFSPRNNRLAYSFVVRQKFGFVSICLFYPVSAG
jgi:hypothetical protein